MILGIYSLILAASLTILVFSPEVRRNPFRKGYWTCLTLVSGSMWLAELVSLFSSSSGP